MFNELLIKKIENLCLWTFLSGECDSKCLICYFCWYKVALNFDELLYIYSDICFTHYYKIMKTIKCKFGGVHIMMMYYFKRVTCWRLPDQCPPH